MTLGALLCALAALQLCTGARDALIRDLPPLPNAICNNTCGGRWYLTDDKGRVCHRDVLDYTTGCCDKGAQHSCETCEASDQCCTSYAHCVSCCMGANNNVERRLQEVPRGLNKPETGYWTQPFEYCESVCRTSSRSTQHENAYILERRFCFSKLGRPRLPLPPLPLLPPNIIMATSQPGQSCNEACWGVRRGCSAEHIASFNDCNALRELFPCEAGCSRTNPTQTEFPGYVKPGSPKWQLPALCVVLSNTTEGQLNYNCSAATNNIVRVCACKEVPPEELPPPSPPPAANGTAATATSQDGGAAMAAAPQQGAGKGAQQQPQQQQQQQQAEQAEPHAPQNNPVQPAEQQQQATQARRMSAFRAIGEVLGGLLRWT